MRQTRRKRRQSSGGSWRLLFGIVLVAFALLVLPSVSFTSGVLDRGETIDVVDDDAALIGLDVTEELTVGGTSRLVTVTNNANETLTFTVALDDAAADVGDLYVDGTNQGDSATFTLAPDATKKVSIDLAADCSLYYRSVPFNVTADAPGLEGVVDRGSAVAAGEEKTSVAYVASDGSLSLVDRDGSTTDLAKPNPESIGSYSLDIDCDGRNELPYGPEKSPDINLIDDASSDETLVGNGVEQGVRYAVGDWDRDKNLSVAFSNKFDELKLKEYGQVGEVSVKAGGATVTGHSVADIADFNGDGDRDIIFTDNNANLKYFDDDTVVDTGIDVSDPTAIGDAADFDGDGTISVPIKGTDGTIRLAQADGTTTTLSSTYTGAVNGSIAVMDWNDDGTLDVLTVNGNDNNYIYYLQPDGTNRRIEDSAGNPVAGTTLGVA